MSNRDLSRWACQFEGCTKSFLRKEHLTRHQASHSARPSHVCTICGKEFSRSDGLQRHVGKHGQQFKKQSGRSRRACTNCHARKLKCDGSRVCSRCSKNSIACVYTSQSVQRLEASNKDCMSDTDPHETLACDEHADNQNAVSRSNTARETLHSREDNALNSNTTIVREIFSDSQERSGYGFIDWSKLKIQQDLTPLSRDTAAKVKDSLIMGMDDLCLPPQEVKERFERLYIEQFHDRWPIIHLVSYEYDTEELDILIPSILMIGAWIDGTPQSKEWALKVHARLIECIIPRLCRVTTLEPIARNTPVGLYQAALQCIIFRLYCGSRTVLARALVLRNILAAAMHALGIFEPHILFPDDKPGYFLPLRMVKREQRHRLATFLYKADTYASLIEGQSPLIRSEELHFNLLQTYANWHSNGLHILEARYADEPKSRQQRKVHDMIEESDFETVTSLENEHTLEDIQICFWGTQSRLWRLSQQIRNGGQGDLVVKIQRETLRQQLEKVKRGMVRISSKLTDQGIFEQADRSPVRFYFGTESQDEPGWQEIVVQRIGTFIHDTSILYHLMNLQLFSDLWTLRRLAKDPSLSQAREIFGENYSQPRKEREVSTRAWVQTSDARRALWHASEVLLLHNKIGALANQRNYVQDPVSYIALCTSALIVWAHCTYGPMPCHTGAPPLSLPHNLGISIELTKLSEVLQGAFYDGKDKEVWIEKGILFRPAIEDVQMCGCNLGILLEKFGKYVPNDWDIKEAIAPGLFKAN